MNPKVMSSVAFIHVIINMQNAEYQIKLFTLQGKQSVVE